MAHNFYNLSLLNLIVALIGTYIHCDNATRCATRTNGARVCVKLDAANFRLMSFWIGAPFALGSRLQEVDYETLPTFCVNFKMQGHNLETYIKRNLDKHKDKNLVYLEYQEVKKQIPVESNPSIQKEVG